MASVGRNIWEGTSAAVGRWSAGMAPGLRTYGSFAAGGALIGAGLSLVTRDDLKDKVLGIPVYAGLGAAAGIGLAVGGPMFVSATKNVRHTMDIATRGVDTKDHAAVKALLEQIERDPKITPANKSILRKAYSADGVAPDINYARATLPTAVELQNGAIGTIQNALNERHWMDLDGGLVGTATRDNVPQWWLEGLERDEIWPRAKALGKNEQLRRLEQARRYDLVDVEREMTLWDSIGRANRARLNTLAGMTEIDRFSPQAKAIDFLRDTWLKPPAPDKVIKRSRWSMMSDAERQEINTMSKQALEVDMAAFHKRAAAEGLSKAEIKSYERQLRKRQAEMTWNYKDQLKREMVDVPIGGRPGVSLWDSLNKLSPEDIAAGGGEDIAKLVAENPGMTIDELHKLIIRSLPRTMPDTAVDAAMTIENLKNTKRKVTITKTRWQAASPAERQAIAEDARRAGSEVTRAEAKRLRARVTADVPQIENLLSTDPAALANVEVPVWLKLALHSAESDATKNRYIFDATGTRSTGAVESDLAKWNDWDAVLNALRQAPADARSKEAYFGALDRRLKQFHSADGRMTGLLDAADVVGMRDPVASINVAQRDRVLKMLRAQGREDLAEQVELLGDDVTVIGRHRFDPGERVTIDGTEYSALSELDIHVKGTKAKLTVPVLGEGDVIHTGGQARNAYTMRQQFFIEDLLNARKALQEGADPVVRAMRGDAWALKMAVSYIPELLADGQEVEGFVGWLNEAIKSASTWDVSPYRPDRLRMTANKPMHAVRRNQAMIQTPEQVALLRRMGLVGAGGFIDEFNGLLEDTSIIEALRRAGYVMLGSESAARKGVYDRVSGALSLHYGTVSGHFGKPIQFMRDPAKPFFVRATDPKLKAGQWLPFATDSERLLYRPYERDVSGRFMRMAESAPLVGEYHGLYDREIQFFKDYVEYAKETAAGRTYSPVMNGIEGELKAFHELVQRHGGGDDLVSEIEKLSRVNEGVNALAIEEGYEMVNTSNATVKALNMDLLSEGSRELAANKKLDIDTIRKELIGKELDANTLLGWDAAERKIETGTYAGSKHASKIKIVGIEGDRHKGFTIQFEEGFDARHAKFGNIFSKSETQALDTEKIDRLLAALHELRVGANGPFKRLYANQSIVSLMNVTRRNGVFIGFSQMGDIGKLQGPHQFAADTLMSYMPLMDRRARGRLVRRLDSHGIQIRRNVANGQLQGTLNVAEEEATFKRRLLARAAKSDVQRHKMIQSGLVESVNGELQVTEQAFSRHQIRRYNRINAVIENELYDMLEHPDEIFGDAGFWNARMLFSGPEARETLARHLQMARGRHVPDGMTAEDAVRTGRSFVLSVFGLNRVTTSASPWSSVDSNIPQDVALTIHDFMFYKKMGWHDVYNEMMGRRSIYGDMDETKRFYDVYNRVYDLQWRADPTRFAKDMPVYGLDDLRMVSGYDVEARRPIAAREARLWRHEQRFQNNFVIDLSTAHKVKSASEEAVRKALGLTDLRIVAPGVKTDLWGMPYMTLESGATQPEKFVHPLENLTRAVAEYYATGNEYYLKEARSAYTAYHIGLAAHTMDMITGRGGVNPDRGPSIAGIVQYRDYYHQYRGIIPDAGARRVIGVSQKTFDALREQVEAGNPSAIHTFTGRDGEKIEALIGMSKRFPITDVGPAWIIADKSLDDAKHGIAIDEFHRTLKQLDWDGDTLYLHVLMQDASIKNLLPELEGTLKSTAEGTIYRELMRQSKYFNGAKEEIGRRVMEGTDADAVLAIAKKLNPRLTSLADVTGAEVATKYFTTHIGRYSNLSRALGSMSTAVEGQTVSDLAMRMGIAKELEQMSIDFGRAGTRKGFDPTALARQVSEAMEAAASGSVADANEALHRALDNAGLIEAKVSDHAERSESLRKQIAEATDKTVREELEGALSELNRDHDRFLRISEQFFGEHYDVKSGRKILNALKAVMVKPETLGGEEAEEVVGRLGAVMHTIADASEHDIVPGFGSSITTEALSEANMATKRVAALIRLAGNGYAEKFHGFFRTEGGKAVAGLALGALAVGAAIGLLTPATKMGEPSGSGPIQGQGYGPGNGRGDAAARIQRTPDAAMVGADGEAPMPGGGGGNLRGSQGPIDVPLVQSPALVPSRRFYYQQSNTVPRVRARAVGDSREGAELVARASQAARDVRNPARSNVNVTMSPLNRRRSDVEINDDIKNRLYG